MISKLHYITQQIEGQSHSDLAKAACLAGVDWVQLRIKNTAGDEQLQIAKITREICRQHNAKLIINDNVRLAQEINADGVHLGKTDMNPLEARQILGNKSIIGGTANTFEDIERLAKQKVDYIGLGPFRFTSTKENLSPILGLEGYRMIIQECKKNGIMIPVIAIGGIIPEDVDPLKESGIYGVAVSSAINLNSDKEGVVKKFWKYLSYQHDRH